MEKLLRADSKTVPLKQGRTQPHKKGLLASGSLYLERLLMNWCGVEPAPNSQWHRLSKKNSFSKEIKFF